MHRSPLIGREDWWPWQLYPLSATSQGGGDLSNLRFTPLEEETKRHRTISRGRVSPILSGISQLPSYRCRSSGCHGNCYHGAECAGSPCHLLFSHSFTFHLSPLPPYLNDIKLNTHTHKLFFLAFSGLTAGESEATRGDGRRLVRNIKCNSRSALPADTDTNRGRKGIFKKKRFSLGFKYFREDYFKTLRVFMVGLNAGERICLANICTCISVPFF